MNGLLQLHPSDVLLHLSAVSRDDALSELVARVALNHSEISEPQLFQSLLDREILGSTGIGDGIALPHCKSPALKVPVILFGRSDSGIDFQSLDDRPVRLLFLLVIPEGADAVHLQLLSRISRILKGAAVRSRLLEAVSEDEVVAIVMEQGESGDRHKPFN